MRLGADADARASAASRHGGVAARQLAGRGRAADLRPGQPRVGARRALARLLDAAGGGRRQHPLQVQARKVIEGTGCVSDLSRNITRDSSDASTQSGVWEHGAQPPAFRTDASKLMSLGVQLA